MTADELRENLAAMLDGLSAHGFETSELVVDPPATEADVHLVERTLGFPIPSEFRRVLTSVSRHVDLNWSAPGDHEFPPPFKSSFSGALSWSLDILPELDSARMGWIDECFPNVEDEYDVVWHNKLALLDVPNGDQIAIDLRPESIGSIIYLSHDYGEGHGFSMAPSFNELLARWIPLACAGPEDWQWLPFYEQEFSGLNPSGANAHRWKELLGLRF